MHVLYNQAAHIMAYGDCYSDILVLSFFTS